MIDNFKSWLLSKLLAYCSDRYVIVVNVLLRGEIKYLIQNKKTSNLIIIKSQFEPLIGCQGKGGCKNQTNRTNKTRS